MKATKQYFPVVLFIMMYKVFLISESMDEILTACKCSCKIRSRLNSHLFVIGDVSFRIFSKQFSEICSLVLVPSFNVCLQINIGTLQPVIASFGEFCKLTQQM